MRYGYWGLHTVLIHALGGSQMCIPFGIAFNYEDKNSISSTSGTRSGFEMPDIKCFMSRCN